jgi:hypothetical protein
MTDPDKHLDIYGNRWFKVIITDQESEYEIHSGNWYEQRWYRNVKWERVLVTVPTENTHSKTEILQPGLYAYRGSVETPGYLTQTSALYDVRWMSEHDYLVARLKGDIK